MTYSLRDHSVYAFGPFRLDPARQILLRDGQDVHLPPRLFDMLVHLVSHAGRIVSREELLSTIWGGRAVEDGNIKQTVFALRRALREGGGDRFIVTAPARGYRFAGPVRLLPAEDATEIPPPRTRFRPNRLHLCAIVAAACLAGLGAVLLTPGPKPHGSPAIAVLPFANLTGDPGEDAVAEGFSAGLTENLSRAGGLLVAARSSAAALNGRALPAPEIARRLGTNVLLEGVFRRESGRLRITAGLVDGATGFTIWSRVYDGSAAGLAPAEGALTNAVRETLSAGGPAPGPALVSGDPQAFDAYLRGIAAGFRPGGAEAALPFLNEAVRRDPDFAPALAARADAQLAIANAGAGGDLRRADRLIEAALADAGRAIALAPELGSAHLARGAALMSIQRFRDADKEISLAHRLAPGDARVLSAYALTQYQFGRLPQALGAARDAAGRDPLSPGPYVLLASLASAAHLDGEADSALRRARILGGEEGARAVEQGRALASGDDEAARQGCDAAPGWRKLLCRSIALRRAQPADAQAALASLHAALGDTGAYQYAQVLAQWGRAEEAVQWLRTALRLHDPGLALMKSDALLAPLRADAGYRAVEAALGFPGDGLMDHDPAGLPGAINTPGRD